MQFICLSNIKFLMLLIDLFIWHCPPLMWIGPGLTEAVQNLFFFFSLLLSVLLPVGKSWREGWGFAMITCAVIMCSVWWKMFFFKTHDSAHRFWVVVVFPLLNVTEWKQTQMNVAVVRRRFIFLTRPHVLSFKHPITKEKDPCSFTGIWWIPSLHAEKILPSICPSSQLNTE